MNSGFFGIKIKINLKYHLLDFLKDGARDELPILVHAGVKERAVAFVGPLFDETSRNNADHHGVYTATVHERTTVIVLEVKMHLLFDTPNCFLETTTLQRKYKSELLVQ